MLTNGKAILNHTMPTCHSPKYDDKIAREIFRELAESDREPQTIKWLLSAKLLRKWSGLGPILHERKEALSLGYFGGDTKQKAMAAIVNSEKWLLDSGAGVHFMPKACVKGDTYEAAHGLHLQTACGPIKTKERAYVYIPCLEFRVEAVIVPGKCCALSLGMLVRSGF